MRIKISKLLIPLDFNTKYTEEYAYNNSGDYIVIDGSTQNYEYKLKIDTYDYDMTVISITTVGYYAGHVNYYKGKFSVGNNVACYKLSDYAINNNLDVRYLVFNFFNVSKKIISGESGGYAALNTKKFENSVIDIDTNEKQKEIVDFMIKREELFSLENKLTNAFEKMDKFQLSGFDGEEYPITKVLDLIGGSSYLTEEFLYNNSDDLDNLIPVYTGALSFNGRYVNRSKCSKIFSNSLKLTRKGLAGQMMYIKGDFTINDDAYVIKIKEDFVENVNIHFLHFYLSTLVLGAVSSEDGNGTFNKTKFLSYDVKLPDIKFQNKYGELFERYLELKEICSKIKEFRIELNKNIYNLIY